MTPEPVTPARAVAGLPPRPPVRGRGDVSSLIRANRPDPEQVGAQTTPAEPAATHTAPGPAGPPQGSFDDEAAAASTQPPDPIGVPAGLTDSQSAGVPKYLRLERREARLHARQVSELGDLTRVLNEARRRGARTGVGERITDNTLVRVAVDLLLRQPGRLRGTTEDELRASVDLPPLEQPRPDGAVTR